MLILKWVSTSYLYCWLQLGTVEYNYAVVMIDK